MQRMIMVTGSEGFIGSQVLWKLKSLGFDARGIDKKSGFDIQKMSHSDAQVVVHCAANLFDNFGENIESTKKLVVMLPNAHFIFTSSAAVYGNNGNAKEDDQLNPWGDYGYSKMIEEEIIRQVTAKHTILRLGNVYGYGTDHGIFHKLLGGERQLNNNGESIRDFVHVEDVVNTMIRAIISDLQGTYNVATGVGTSIAELFYKLNPNQNYINSGFKEEIAFSILNVNKLKKTGYKPRGLV